MTKKAAEQAAAAQALKRLREEEQDETETLTRG